MLRSEETSVAIVGGGIAGLALARVLQAGNVAYQVIERRRAPWDGGLAVNLPGNAIHALTALGLKEQIEASGHPLHRREYRTARDKLLFEVDEDAFWGPDLRPRSIRRSALLSMLAEDLPAAALRYDAEMKSLTVHSALPQIELTDGARLRAGILVGADGVRSRVRSEAFGNVGGPGIAKIADASWRFMAPNPGIDCWTVWAGGDGMVLLMPVGEGEVYGWAAVTRPRPNHAPEEALLRLAGQFPRRVQDAIQHAVEQPQGLYHSPLEEVRLERWSSRHVVLMGDAAHATAPVWAEGVALALEDAIVLGRLLATNTNIPSAFVAYENRQRPRVRHVQALTDAMSKAAKLPPFVRNALMPLVGPKRYRQTYEPLKEAP